MTTKMANPHYLPEVRMCVQVIEINNQSDSKKKKKVWLWRRKKILMAWQQDISINNLLVYVVGFQMLNAINQCSN